MEIFYYIYILPIGMIEKESCEYVKKGNFMHVGHTF